MAIVGKVGAVYAVGASVVATAFTDKPTTKDTERKRYQITDTSLRYWPPEEAITVKKNGAAITTGFTLERVGGIVVFEEALLTTDAILISGKALPMAQCGGFFNWSVDTEADTADITTFASGGWKDFMQTLNNWSGNAEAYWGNANFVNAVGTMMVMKLYIDAGVSQQCLEGYGIITGDGIEVPNDGIVSESVDFQGTGPLYFRV